MSDHTPVMLNEALEHLDIKPSGKYVDCTFGAGGFSNAILAKFPHVKLIGVDRDSSISKYAKILKDQYRERFEIKYDNFANILSIMNGELVDGIVLDLGVSSMQLNEAERGFSFLHEGPLDMRMGCNTMSAFDFINNENEVEIANVIYKYGDEVFSRKIAKRIVETRDNNGSIQTTTQLANIIREAIPKNRGKIDLATKSFQAIRIFVNDEMGSLERFLSDVYRVLKPSARLVIITFHSIEDRIVKQFFKLNSIKKIAKSKYRDIDDGEDDKSEFVYKLVTKKSVKPSREEILFNPRARSAKLRSVIKI